ncbi:MAG: hypothetical protein HY882_07650 [Deltaproteobacteria bacterium]|nr:hypothetical protein [Deltaproteobacteria bacterium]
MDKKGGFRFIVEEVFTIPGRGVVVTGKVEEGSVSVGQEIGFLGTDGKWISALVIGIEVSRRLVEEAEAGQRASILLEGVRKNQITLGTALMEVPAAPVPPPSPAAPQPAYPPVVAVPSEPSLGKAIHPPSSMWRTVLFIVIGILIILAILYFQDKWDPSKWDPRKMRKSFQLSAISNQQSAIGGIQSVKKL